MQFHLFLDHSFVHYGLLDLEIAANQRPEHAAEQDQHECSDKAANKIVCALVLARRGSLFRVRWCSRWLRRAHAVEVPLRLARLPINRRIYVADERVAVRLAAEAGPSPHRVDQRRLDAIVSLQNSENVVYCIHTSHPRLEVSIKLVNCSPPGHASNFFAPPCVLRIRTSVP